MLRYAGLSSQDAAKAAPTVAAAGMGAAAAAGLSSQLQALHLGLEERQHWGCLGRETGDSGAGGGGGGDDEGMRRRQRGGEGKGGGRRLGLPLLPHLRELSVMWLKELSPATLHGLLCALPSLRCVTHANGGRRAVRTADGSWVWRRMEGSSGGA